MGRPPEDNLKMDIRTWRPADMSTQPKIDPRLLQARSNRLKQLLEAYSDSEPEGCPMPEAVVAAFCRCDGQQNPHTTPRCGSMRLLLRRGTPPTASRVRRSVCRFFGCPA